MNATATYTVWSLDVWGHGPDEHEDYECDGECDGYQINDRCRVGTIAVESSGDEAILQALKDGAFIKESVTPEQVEFDDAGDVDIYLHDASNGRPVFQLEKEDE